MYYLADFYYVCFVILFNEIQMYLVNVDTRKLTKDERNTHTAHSKIHDTKY